MSDLPKELIHINRYNSKVLEMFIAIGILQNEVNNYVLKPTEDNLKILIEKVSLLEARFENMKNSLLSVIKEINNEDSLEFIDGEQTEDGIRL